MVTITKIDQDALFIHPAWDCQRFFQHQNHFEVLHELIIPFSDHIKTFDVKFIFSLSLIKKAVSVYMLLTWLKLFTRYFRGFELTFT